MEMSHAVRSVTAEFTAEVQSVGAARRATANAINRIGLAFAEDRVETAQLLVSEVVTNAVLYGSPQADGELRIVWSTLGDDMLKVAVTDQAAAVPRLRVAGTGDEHGRGLDIVRQLATNSGWQSEPDGGKTVWFTLARTAPTARTAKEFALSAPAVTTQVLRAHGLLPGLRPAPSEPEAIRPRRRRPAELQTFPAA